MATITGSNVNDSLFGDGDGVGDYFFGLGGNDNILASNSHDTLDGGAGNDTLNGSGGYDIASYRTTGAVNVSLFTGIATGAGTDTLYSIEDVWGSDFNDSITGNDVDNYLYGYLGNDSIRGGGSGDLLIAGGGNDTLEGDAGNDTLTTGDTILANTTSWFNGGSESDLVNFYGDSLSGAAFYGSLLYGLNDDVNSVVFNFSNVERLYFVGSATGGIVSGGASDDTLIGLEGNDSFDGGRGNNMIYGDAGFDVASVDYSDRTGNLYLVNRNSEDLPSEAVVDGLYAGEFDRIEVLNIVAGSGNDTIGGVVYNGANLSLDGGNGSDVAIIDASALTGSSFYGGLSGGYTTLINVTDYAEVNLSNIEALNFYGNANTSYYYVLGGSGDDTLTGMAGNDRFDGYLGNNIIDGGAGNDVANVNYSDRTGNLWLVNGGVADTTYTATVGGVAAGTIRNIELLGVTGGSGDDTIGGVVGASGESVSLDGGLGNDVAIVDASALTGTNWYSSGTTLYDTTSSRYIYVYNIEALKFTGNAQGTVSGGDGNDTLTGLSGNDMFDGGRGNNVIDGGAGSDWAAVSFADRSGNVSLINGGVANTTYTATVGGVAAGTVRNIEALNITGGSGNDTIGGVVADGVYSTLDGGDGTDVAVVNGAALTGVQFYGGIDYGYIGHTGGSGGYVNLYSIEVLSFIGNATDGSPIRGGDGNDTLTGLGGNDTFVGGRGNNVIDGGAGARDLVSLDYSDRTGNLWLVNGGVAGTTYTATVSGVAAGTVRNIEAISIRGGAGNDTIGGAVFSGANIELQGGDGLDVAVITSTAAFSGGLYTGYLNDTGFGSISLYTTEILNFTGGATYGVVYGGYHGDTLTGLGGNDSFDGAEGDDSISGAAGADQLVGEAGNDTLSGGDGADVLSGGADNDSLLGGSRWDTLVGSDGDDTLDGGLDNDQMYGGIGDDIYYVDNTGDRTYETTDEGIDGVFASISWSLSADVEHLRLTGTAATGTGNGLANVIIGTDGANTLIGGGGNDTLDGMAGADSLDGGANNDVLFGGARWDTLIGGDGSDTLAGGLDNDQMYGGLGNDVYYVDNAGDRVNESTTINEGSDTVYASITWNMTANIEAVVFEGTGHFSSTGNSLHNTMTGNSGNNTFTGSTGHDTISGLDGNDSLDGGTDSDVLYGGEGNDTLLGGQRWDTLEGGAGNDVLDGGTENDRMTGGAGNDAYYVDHVGDRVFELTGEGFDTVYSAIDFALGADLEVLFLSGTAVSGTGNGLNNAIIGTAGNNSLSGGNGNDTLTGNAGADTLTGGTGRDDFVFSGAAGNGTDRITDFVHGIDRLVFGAASYGFAAGHVLTNAQFTAGTTAVGTSAQFIWDAASKHLYWDADGTNAGARIDLGLLDGATVTKEDLFFI